MVPLDCTCVSLLSAQHPPTIPRRIGGARGDVGLVHFKWYESCHCILYGDLTIISPTIISNDLNFNKINVVIPDIIGGEIIVSKSHINVDAMSCSCSCSCSCSYSCSHSCCCSSLLVALIITLAPARDLARGRDLALALALLWPLLLSLLWLFLECCCLCSPRCLCFSCSSSLLLLVSLCCSRCSCCSCSSCCPRWCCCPRCFCCSCCSSRCQTHAVAPAAVDALHRDPFAIVAVAPVAGFARLAGSYLSSKTVPLLSLPQLSAVKLATCVCQAQTR